MPRDVQVHLLPALTTPESLAGDAVVVIDVLRATTTMLRALEQGAAAVLPCLTIDEARSTAKLLGDETLLGGERGGVRIDGFHLGNSPSEYTAARVAGRTVVFTTTNGTRALHAAQRARRILIGALTNLTVLAQHLADEPVVHLLCAGTDGSITAEDALLAGALAAAWSGQSPDCRLNDQGQLAAAAWNATVLQGIPLVEALRRSSGGQNLVALGYDADLVDCAALDATPLLAEFDATQRRVRRYTPTNLPDA